MFKNDPISISNKITSGIDTIKKSLDHTFKPLTFKHRSHISGHIYPLVNVNDCRMITRNYPILAAIIRILANDIILNEFNFYLHQKCDNFYELDQFWINNKPELMKAVKQFLGYGFGACEVLMDNVTLEHPTKLKQIDCQYLSIAVRKFNGKEYHYAEYRKNNELIKLFRITREDYEDVSPLDDKSVGYVIWLGGDTENEFFSEPAWTSAYLDIITALKKKELDFNVIQEGNLPKGVLFIKSPPSISHEGEESTYSVLKRHFKESRGGVAISYLETPVNDLTMSTEYVKLQDDNYDYLNQLILATDDLIFCLYGVPKIRLMVYNGKNRNDDEDTASAYEIYTRDLNNYQLPIEQEIDIFNQDFFGVTTTTDIITPVFAETAQIKVQTIIDLFSVGLITLKEAISRITPLYPDMDWSDVDFNDPELNQRFYHGMLFSTPGVDTGMEGLLYENMRGGMTNSTQFHPDATPEELHLPPRSLFGR